MILHYSSSQHWIHVHCTRLPRPDDGKKTKIKWRLFHSVRFQEMSPSVKIVWSVGSYHVDLAAAYLYPLLVFSSHFLLLNKDHHTASTAAKCHLFRNGAWKYCSADGIGLNIQIYSLGQRLHTLIAVPRSFQPSTLHQTVNEYQLLGWVIIINGDGRCGW